MQNRRPAKDRFGSAVKNSLIGANPALEIELRLFGISKGADAFSGWSPGTGLAPAFWREENAGLLVSQSLVVVQ
jgi:hypothetical protein